MSDKDRGAVVFDLGLNFHPAENNEFQVTLSFGAGNGLNNVNPFFDGWDESNKEKLQGIGLSADQEINPILGVFVRAGWQDDDAAIDHDALYSCGLSINGGLWGREDDAAGLGYAYLDGASKGEIDNTNAVEAYVKFQTSAFSDITLDAQYMIVSSLESMGNCKPVPADKSESAKHVWAG